jgi:hypothetical protein
VSMFNHKVEHTPPPSIVKLSVDFRPGPERMTPLRK